MRMKREDGAVVSSKDEKGVWKDHSECLMNEYTAGETTVLSMGIKMGGNQVAVQRLMDVKKSNI